MVLKKKRKFLKSQKGRYKQIRIKVKYQDSRMIFSGEISVQFANV